MQVQVQPDRLPAVRTPVRQNRISASILIRIKYEKVC